jgi:hypothetical protein
MFFVTIAVAVALGQTPTPRKPGKPFVAKEYPAGRFRVTKIDYALGEITVRVINVRNLGNDYPKDVPHFCSAWVEMRRGEELVKRFYYGDIEPVGFSFGAFVPRHQLLPDYFLVVKEGDYDGRLLVINRDGGVVDLPGGFYFVTTDKRFLVSQLSSDEPGLTVFDLANRRIALKPRDMADSDSWYHDKLGYFFTEYENPGNAGRLDLRNHRIVKIKVSESDLKKATKVRYAFDPRKKQDCTSVQQ